MEDKYVFLQKLMETVGICKPYKGNRITSRLCEGCRYKILMNEDDQSSNICFLGVFEDPKDVDFS